jgi:RHS repeat-associated protein
MAGISDKALNKIASRYKFNSGTEIEEDYDVNLYSTFFRQYDPQLGRFSGVDILAECTTGLSPYHFSGNNPVRFSDPTGASMEAPDYKELEGVTVVGTRRKKHVSTFLNDQLCWGDRDMGFNFPGLDFGLDNGSGGGSSNGSSSGVGWVPLTNEKFEEILNSGGILNNGWDFNIKKGFGFEDAFLRAFNSSHNTSWYWNSAHTKYAIPDAAQFSYYAMRFPKRAAYSRSLLYEVKAVKSAILLTPQITAEIEGAANRTVIGYGSTATAGELGLADLVIVTFAGITIDKAVETAARNSNVGLWQIVPLYNQTTNEIWFLPSLPLVIPRARGAYMPWEQWWNEVWSKPVELDWPAIRRAGPYSRDQTGDDD